MRRLVNGVGERSSRDLKQSTINFGSVPSGSGRSKLGRDAAEVGLGGLLGDDQVSQVLASVSIQAL